MELFDSHERIYQFNKPGLSFIVVLLISFVIFAFVGQFIGIIIAMPFMEFGLMEFPEVLTPPFDERARIPLFIIQGVASTLGFIVFPLIYLKAVQKKKISVLFQGSTPAILLISTVLIVLSFMLVNAVFIEWNAGLQFPESWSGLERVFRNFETQAEELTRFLTKFDHFGQFFLALIVIAIVPAIGEELLFRGLLQRMAHQTFNNIHVAIWLSALIFSAFHLQFFGFIPRLLLGALFGYLMFWSGTLLIPILAHFINNGFTLLMVYLYHSGKVNFDIENTESVPMPTVLIFTVITSLLLVIFFRVSKREQSGEVA